MISVKSLINMSEAQAKELIKAAGMTCRIVECNNIPMCRKMDAPRNRISLYINNGIVVKAEIG